MFDKERYKKALHDIQVEIKICSEHALHDDGRCICFLYPCWKFVAKEAIEKQIKMQFEEVII